MKVSHSREPHPWAAEGLGSRLSARKTARVCLDRVHNELQPTIYNRVGARLQLYNFNTSGSLIIAVVEGAVRVGEKENMEVHKVDKLELLVELWSFTPGCNWMDVVKYASRMVILHRVS